jgi:hypothetical protein
MKQQRSTLEKRNPLEERKSGDAVGRPSRRSSLLGDPGEKFLGGKLKSSLNSVSTCLKVVDTRRPSVLRIRKSFLVKHANESSQSCAKRSVGFSVPIGSPNKHHFLLADESLHQGVEVTEYLMAIEGIRA